MPVPVWNVPVAQAWHVLDATAPEAVEKVPVPQAAQEALVIIAVPVE